MQGVVGSLQSPGALAFCSFIAIVHNDLAAKVGLEKDGDLDGNQITDINLTLFPMMIQQSLFATQKA